VPSGLRSDFPAIVPLGRVLVWGMVGRLGNLHVTTSTLTPQTALMIRIERKPFFGPVPLMYKKLTKTICLPVL
jgi:hypothetical protein